MNDRDAAVVRTAMDLIAKGLIRPGVLALGEPVVERTDLERKVNALAIHLQFAEVIRLTDAALAGVSQALVDAHRAATRLEVQCPSAQQVQDFRRALEDLLEDIRQRHAAHPAVNLIVSLKRAIPDLA